MNRTIKEATVKPVHYESHDQLRTHPADFMAAYNQCPGMFVADPFVTPLAATTRRGIAYLMPVTR